MDGNIGREIIRDIEVSYQNLCRAGFTGLCADFSDTKLEGVKWKGQSVRVPDSMKGLGLDGNVCARV